MGKREINNSRNTNGQQAIENISSPAVTEQMQMKTYQLTDNLTLWGPTHQVIQKRTWGSSGMTGEWPPNAKWGAGGADKAP